eukprot:m.162860 g.162860  ORF g.162860 m.162860 type:complete len:624 (+) comp53065_c0_seq2:29-1900(+)
MVLSQGVAFALLVLVAAVASVSAWTSIGAYPTADELSSLSVSPSGVVLITGYDNTLLHVPNATALRSGVTHAWSFIEAGTRSPDWVEGAYFYASTYSPAANAFFVSADGGRIVRCDIAGTSVESCTVVFGLFDSWMGDNLRAITASTGSTLIACGAAQIYVSTNMGVGWIPTPVTSSSYQFNVITYSSTLTVNGVTGFFIGAGGSSYNSPESASNAAVAISHDGTIWTAIAESNNFPEWKCEDSFTTLTVSDKFIIASGCQQFYPEVYLAAPISNLSDWAPISIPSAAESSNFTFNVFAWAEEQGVFVANGYSTKSPRQNYVAYCDDASLDNWTVVSLDTELDNLAMFQYVPVLGGMLGVGTLGNVWTSNWPPEKWHRSNTNPFYVSGPNTFYLYELTDVAIGSTSTANSIIIVTGYGPVSISSDNGQSWHSSSPNQDGASFTVLYEPENNALVAIQVRLWLLRCASLFMAGLRFSQFSRHFILSIATRERAKYLPAVHSQLCCKCFSRVENPSLRPQRYSSRLYVRHDILCRVRQRPMDGDCGQRNAEPRPLSLLDGFQRCDFLGARGACWHEASGSKKASVCTRPLFRRLVHVPGGTQRLLVVCQQRLCLARACVCAGLTV